MKNNQKIKQKPKNTERENSNCFFSKKKKQMKKSKIKKFFHPRGSIWAIPPHVAIFLKYLAAQMRVTRHHSCVVELHSTTAPRVDALASSTRMGLGGWLPHLQTARLLVQL